MSLFPREHKMPVQSGDSYSYRAEYTVQLHHPVGPHNKHSILYRVENEFIYEGWNFNSGNYLFATDTK